MSYNILTMMRADSIASLYQNGKNSGKFIAHRCL